MRIADKFEERAVVSGVGQSAVGRRLGRSALDLTVEACLLALDDAGLRREDIDGVSTWPARLDRSHGFAEVGVAELVDALRLELKWWSGGREGSGQLGSVINAFLAVASGLCTHVVCFRTVTEAMAQGSAGRRSVYSDGTLDSIEPSDYRQWLMPFGAPSAVNWTAMFAQWHFATFGTTREQLAMVALTDRANAALNPNAIYRSPVSLDEYLSARMISSPLCLLDCDVPVDGSTAVVVSRADATAGLRRDPVRVEAVGTAFSGRWSWDQRIDVADTSAIQAAQSLWRRTELRAADVDIAHLYDGFSILTLLWLEALGFCNRGESGSFIESGQRIARDGELPINTDGGMLSAGRLHGFGGLHEACRQIWGEAGDRQVSPTPEIAAVAVGAGPFNGCLLLTR